MILSGKFDVVMPTLGHPHHTLALKFVDGLRDYPLNIHLIRDGKSWPAAVNLGLRQLGSQDVLLMDDDVFVTPRLLRHVAENYERADIFGFKLLWPDGMVQHAGGWIRGGQNGPPIGHFGYGDPDQGNFDQLLYVAHATTSLIYIKNHVIEKLKGMAEDYPGIQCEDVDFSIRALKAGFKILYTPGTAVHLESQTKKTLPLFKVKMAQNLHELKARHLDDPEVQKMTEQYPKVLEALHVV